MSLYPRAKCHRLMSSKVSSLPSGEAEECTTILLIFLIVIRGWVGSESTVFLRYVARNVCHYNTYKKPSKFIEQANPFPNVESEFFVAIQE